MSEVTLKVKALEHYPKEWGLPEYKTAGAIAFDLRAALFNKVSGNVFKAYTGLAFEIPEGYGLFIFSRSGHGFKSHTRLSNCVGVIDSDYRGEVIVQLHRDFVQLSEDSEYGVNEPPCKILNLSKGDRIAQAVLLQIPKVSLQFVDTLDITERGAQGFGSTGNA